MSRISPDVLKAAVSPTSYYTAMLPTMKNPRREGWIAAGLCPFHDNKHDGNFRIDLAGGAFFCHACGAKGGDIISFHKQHCGMSFKDALADLVEHYLWSSS